MSTPFFLLSFYERGKKIKGKWQRRVEKGKDKRPALPFTPFWIQKGGKSVEKRVFSYFIGISSHIEVQVFFGNINIHVFISCNANIMVFPPYPPALRLDVECEGVSFRGFLFYKSKSIWSRGVIQLTIMPIVHDTPHMTRESHRHHHRVND